MPGRSPTPEGEARQARDVMAFGQEVGRVLSDGRIVGRAEPFAKVFASSRAVKRAVGLAAWGVLEDIALDARLDDAGRLVAETNVRRIAANLGLNKDTVSRHLRTLREYGFVLHEEERAAQSGRYISCRYVLDPSACVERFTVTPPQPRAASQPRPGSSDTGWPAPVSEDAGHGATGHGEPGQVCRDVVVPEKGQQQQTADGLRERLLALTVSERVADDLLARHDAARVTEVLSVAEAQSLRRPAGWIVSALRDGWDVSDAAAAAAVGQARERRTASEAVDREAAALADRERQQRADAWCEAISGALDDAQLHAALAQVTAPTPGLRRRSVPICRAQLLAWALAVHRWRPDAPLARALAEALPTASPVAAALDGDLPPAPAPETPRAELSARIAAVVRASAPSASPSVQHPTREEQP
jgi:DNA-binding transcriptional ArsR family regulator